MDHNQGYVEFSDPGQISDCLISYGKLWPEGQILRSIPHTHDRFFFLHTYGGPHMN